LIPAEAASASWAAGLLTGQQNARGSIPFSDMWAPSSSGKLVSRSCSARYFSTHGSACWVSIGDALLATHPIAVLPSVVRSRWWNLLIAMAGEVGTLSLRNRKPALDPRLNPADAPRKANL